MCHADGSPSPASRSSAKRGFLLYAIQVKKRINSTNEPLFVDPAAGFMDYFMLDIKISMLLA